MPRILPPSVQEPAANRTTALSPAASRSGHNWQGGGIVLGIEVDFNALNAKGGVSRMAAVPIVVTPDTYSTSASLDTSWLATFRGRVGWTASPSLLVYATGGLAVTDARVRNAFTDTLAPITAGSSSHDTLTAGYVVGGGVEWALDRKWSVKAEYLFVNFDGVSTSATLTSSGFNANSLNTKVDLDTQIGRVGINYKF
jgi:outer membrane immunogenic protein